MVQLDDVYLNKAIVLVILGIDLMFGSGLRASDTTLPITEFVQLPNANSSFANRLNEKQGECVIEISRHFTRWQVVSVNA
jgi:hypothetical protein